MDGSSSSTQSGGSRTQSELACNICLCRMPNSPVATYYGHVFCWPCLYRSWPQQGPRAQAGLAKSCPVCGTALREGFNIVPIYGYDNVASPRSEAERPTTTGTTTAVAVGNIATSPHPIAVEAAPVSIAPIPPHPTAVEVAPVSNAPIPPHPTTAAIVGDTVTSPRLTAAATALINNTPIPPRPTAASFFTATPHSVAAAAEVVAVPNIDIPLRPTAVSSDTDISPRPNPPARITQRQMQTQTDAARTRILEPNLRSLRYAASTIYLVYEVNFRAGDRLRSASSHTSLGVAPRRPIRRQLELRLNLRGMDGNGGNSSESLRARMGVLNAILAALEAAVAEMNADINARIELEDNLI